MVFWCSKKQISMSLSTTEVVHITLSVGVHKAVWLHRPLKKLFDHDMDYIIITRVV
jgi:hypothetical protein